MYLSEKLQTFIEKYYTLIENDRFEGLYRKLEDEGLKDYRSELSRALLIAEINPLSYMDTALPDMYSNVDELQDVNLSVGFRAIEDRAFSGCNNLRRLVLPHTIEFISDTAFRGCYALKSIYYFGTMEDWKNLNIKNRTFLDCAATKIICRDGAVPN